MLWVYFSSKLRCAANVVYKLSAAGLGVSIRSPLIGFALHVTLQVPVETLHSYEEEDGDWTEVWVSDNGSQVVLDSESDLPAEYPDSDLRAQARCFLSCHLLL